VNIFRIVEQQLANIIQHARATRISIEVIQVQEKITIKITDDGIGFDMNRYKKGMGVSNIIGRSELYNGEVSIVSFPGKGCVLSIVFPLSGNPVTVLAYG
jgi:signal transduction histidine kinase